MLTYILLLFLAALSLYLVHTYRCFLRNLDAAKKSGIPYYITPVHTFNRFWLVTHRLWLPLLYRLPSIWTASWIGFLTPEWPWDKLFQPYEEIGSPVFLIVSPGRNELFVADPDAISQITSRRNDFPKPIEVYQSVNIYGSNVVGTEGSIWRHHRKITSPPFTEKSNVLVFQESVRQAQAMLVSWVGPDGNVSRTLHDVASDAMRLSLHVISCAGFGVRLLWPHEEAGHAAVMPKGHKMTYKDALSNLLEYILLLILLPRWILKYAPFESTRMAYTSFVEWGQYMTEMYEAKKEEARTGVEHQGLDIMGALVRGSGMSSDGSNNPENKSDKGSTSGGAVLSPEEILGNAFVFILAGHETAANTIHFSLLYLAMNPESQRRLQSDIDKIGLSKKDPSDWDYEVDVPKLFGGMVGAVMNEELRLIPPVVSIPKRTHSAQPLNISGRRCVVPANAAVNLVTAAVHRNPAAWPTSNTPLDLNDFRPERWLVSNSSSTSREKPHSGDITTSKLFADGEFGGPGGADTAPTLLHPQKGAYIPFSDGARSCLGRRFAQVEILAVLAVIFREYSVELAVDEFASDEEVAKMDVAGRREVWGRAKDRAEWLLRNGMMTIITIQMRKGKVAMRFVRRGKERFNFE